MKKNILFVCTENSNRSQMAEAFATIHGKNLVNAWSAGSNPSGVINPKAVAAMHEKGYDLNTHHSKSLDEIPEVNFDYAITMGCGDACPMVPAHQKLDWEIPDPKNLEAGAFNQIRDLIEQKVKDLLNQMT